MSRLLCVSYVENLRDQVITNSHHSPWQSEDPTGNKSPDFRGAILAQDNFVCILYYILIFLYVC